MGRSGRTPWNGQSYEECWEEIERAIENSELEVTEPMYYDIHSILVAAYNHVEGAGYLPKVEVEGFWALAKASLNEDTL